MEECSQQFWYVTAMDGYGNSRKVIYGHRIKKWDSGHVYTIKFDDRCCKSMLEQRFLYQTWKNLAPSADQDGRPSIESVTNPRLRARNWTIINDDDGEAGPNWSKTTWATQLQSEKYHRSQKVSIQSSINGETQVQNVMFNIYQNAKVINKEFNFQLNR